MERSLYGQSTVDVTQLAFELAKHGIKHKFISEAKMVAIGCKASSDITIRIPQGTTIAGVVGFNKAKVEQFLKLYKTELNLQLLSKLSLKCI